MKYLFLAACGALAWSLYVVWKELQRIELNPFGVTREDWNKHLKERNMNGKTVEEMKTELGLSPKKQTSKRKKS